MQQNYEQQQQAEEQKKNNEEMRKSILLQILSLEARDRLAKIKLVKPEKASGIQNALIQAAQSGRLKKVVSEEQLVALLEQDTSESVASKVTFKRRTLDDDW